MTGTMGSGSPLSQKVSIAIAHPPEVVIAHIDGCLVGEVGLHPNHLKETMTCFQPGSPSKIDRMPEQAIGRWAVPGAFVETGGHPKVVTDKDGITTGMPEGLQDSSGLSTRDGLLARSAAERVPKVVKVVAIGVR